MSSTCEDWGDEEAAFVSVVVPVYDMADRIEATLRALSEQSYPRRCYEVIVVDNGSTDDLAVLVSRFEDFQYRVEPRVGSYAARNLGIRAARGEVIAFTDGDCVPAHGWIGAGVRALLASRSNGLVGGLVEYPPRVSGRPTAVEAYDGAVSVQQKDFVELEHFAATANLFTFKHVFDKVGCFDPTLRSGGDRKWGNAVHAAGYRLVYCPQAVVRHAPRTSIGEVIARSRRVVAGNRQLRAADGRGPRASRLRHLLSPWRIDRRLRASGNPQWTTRLGVLLIYAAVKCAQVLELIRLRLGGSPLR